MKKLGDIPKIAASAALSLAIAFSVPTVVSHADFYDPIELIESLDEQTDDHVKGDGYVNNKDLVRLFRYLSGWDVEMY